MQERNQTEPPVMESLSVSLEAESSRLTSAGPTHSSPLGSKDFPAALFLVLALMRIRFPKPEPGPEPEPRVRGEHVRTCSAHWSLPIQFRSVSLQRDVHERQPLMDPQRGENPNRTEPKVCSPSGGWAGEEAAAAAVTQVLLMGGEAETRAAPPLLPPSASWGRVARGSPWISGEFATQNRVTQREQPSAFSLRRAAGISAFNNCLLELRAPVSAEGAWS